MEQQQQPNEPFPRRKLFVQVAEDSGSAPAGGGGSIPALPAVRGSRDAPTSPSVVTRGKRPSNGSTGGGKHYASQQTLARHAGMAQFPGLGSYKLPSFIQLNQLKVQAKMLDSQQAAVEEENAEMMKQVRARMSSPHAHTCLRARTHTPRPAPTPHAPTPPRSGPHPAGAPRAPK